jgi:alanine dehydrogenase
MNWILVTTDTNLPIDVDILIKATAVGNIIKGRVIPETNSIVEVEGSETTYLKEEYSHYCVITDPSKVSPIKSIRYLLAEADYELDKWDSRRDITYNDTDYIAAGVNFGKKEALQDVLRILWGLD